MQALVERLSNLLKQKSMILVTAESCTGGAIAAAITQHAGASAIFDRGFITYSNAAKHEQLGVPNDILNAHGAVSHKTAEAMAKGALTNSAADIAIAVTGIAGPDGGSAEKPVGTVYFGYAFKNAESGTALHHFKGSREDIQNAAAQTALKILIEMLEAQP
jgi:nicotinamide-nucleotide amidase